MENDSTIFDNQLNKDENLVSLIDEKSDNKFLKNNEKDEKYI